MKTLTKIAAVIMLPLSMSASAGFITDWEGTGVNFFSSWLDADTLRIEIDAGNITAGSGWDGAVNIDSIAINAPDAWTWVNASDITLSGPVSFSGPVDGTGLSNGGTGGCGALTLTGNHQCWTGLAALTDDMFFDFTFSGSAVITNYTDTPHLKVRFVSSEGRKTGSLLSQDLNSVPEPSIPMLIGVGLAGIGFASKRRKLKI